MIDYPAARAVALIVQTGSFERAAAALNVTPSAISQRVRQLEERLGAVLIERGSPCTATEKGAWLCRHMEHVGHARGGADGAPAGAGRSGVARRSGSRVNVATNADSLGTWFLAAAAAFTRGSDYLLNIAIDDEDHTADWLRRGRVLAAVTSLASRCRGATSRRWASSATTPRRAPVTGAPLPGGVTPEAIAGAPALTFNQKDRLQHAWVRQALGQDVTFPTHWLPSTQSFVDASLAGMGWALNPVQLVREHLASGRLVELVPGATLDRPLFWQVNRLAADQLCDLTRGRDNGEA